MIKLKMLSYKNTKTYCEITQPLLVIQFELVTKSWKYGKAVEYEVPVHLCYPATQIPAQTLTQESENSNYMTAELKRTLEMILLNPLIS